MYHLNGYFVKKNYIIGLMYLTLRLYYTYTPWNIYLRFHHKMHNVAVK